MADRKAPEEKEAQAPLWVVTYGDLVSLLVTFFVLLYTFSSLDTERFRRVQGSLSGAFGLMTENQSRPDLVKKKVSENDPVSINGVDERPTRPDYEDDNELMRKVQSSQFDVSIDLQRMGDGVRILLKGNDLFRIGSEEISRSGVQTLAEIGRLFRSLPVRLVAEAHTDDRTYKIAGYENPRDLTRKMAFSVSQQLAELGAIAPPRVGMASMGDGRPRESNQTAVGRQRNRRVEILVIPTEEKKG